MTAESKSSGAFSKSFTSDAPQQESVPSRSADKARGTTGSLPVPFLTWAVTAVALFFVCIIGWIYAPVRPEPFEDPPPPLSLGWWIYAPTDPGIADLDMVPVGRFGSFLPREIARNIRVKAPFTINDIADVYVQPDGQEIVLSLYDPSPPLVGRAMVYYSGDGGKTWSEPPIAKLPSCGARGQGLKIQWFDPGAASVATDCFPTELPDPSSLDAGLATTSVLIRTGTKGDGLWLTTKMGPVWIVNGNSAIFKLPNKERPTIVRPHPDNRILVASADGFVTLTPRQLQLGGPVALGTESPALTKGDGSAAIPPKIGAPPNLAILPPDERDKLAAGAVSRKAFNPAQQGLPQVQQRAPVQNIQPLLPPAAKSASEVSLPVVSALTAIQDPAYPNRNTPIRTIRVSNDGKTVVVAQNVARNTGVLVSHDAGQSWSRLGYSTGTAPWVVFVAFPLVVMAGTAAARHLIRKPAGERSIADEAATDRPIGLYDVDALQFEPIARGLLMFIRNPQTEPPVTIAVTGPWGSGKTSLMNILRDLLREHDACPVWFNAWHHQKEKHLLAALIENIRQQAIPSVGTWAGLFFRLRLLRRRFAGRLGVMLVLLAAALFVIGSYLSLSEQTTKQLQTSLLRVYLTATDKKPEQPAATDKRAEQPAEHDAGSAKGQKGDGDWLLALIALLPTGLAVPALLFGILKNLQAFPRAKPEQLLGALKKDRGDFTGQLSFRYRFEREFRETAAALRSSASPGLIVFIDDLDRCHAQNVIELLEAINFIVSAGECFVIVGMAKDQIRRSILASYKSEFLDIPKEAVRDGDIEAARRRFADRYLEKMINIEVPVPQASTGQIKSLLTGSAKRPDLPPGVAVRRRLRFVYDNGPVIIAVGFLVALFVWVHPHLAQWSPFPPLPPPIADAGPPAPNDSQASAAVDFTIPPVYASDKDLASAAPRASFPWSQFTLAMALLTAAGAYLTRLWVLAKQRPASDSQPFREALELWTSVIFLTSRTPRAVKQYKNMLRYQAMRLRTLQAIGDAKANILEPDLVALAAISLADRALLAGAIPPAGKPIRLLVKDAAVNAPPDDRAVLEQISASLDKRERTAREGAPSAALEFSIRQYLALLPPAI
jgi:KAP-like P-loop domain-containing protein